MAAAPPAEVVRAQQPTVQTLSCINKLPTSFLLSLCETQEATIYGPVRVHTVGPYEEDGEFGGTRGVQKKTKVMHICASSDASGETAGRQARQFFWWI